MKFVGAMLVGIACGAAYAGPAEDLLKKQCEKANPVWKLAKPVAPLKKMEASIKLYGADGRMVLICNCTPGAVWVRSDDLSENATRTTPVKSRVDQTSLPRFPHLLPGSSCTVAGSATVVLAPVDDSVESWGTFELEAK